jgi:signal transduction histidine kinase
VRRRPLIRSAGVRFALIYAAVFGLSAAVLAFSLWYSTVGLLQREVEAAIRNDAASLAEHAETGGLPSLVFAIHERLVENIDGDAIYLLVDPLGNRVAGNVTHWPNGVDQAGAFYETPIDRGSEHSVALVQAYSVQGGFRLLVGRDVRARVELRRLLTDGLFWAVGLMVGLGAIGAAIVRTLFKRALADIAATTRAIARGDLSRRVRRAGTGDEFDELADTINDMLDRIARLMDGVRQVSNAIAHDLRTPITRARARLEDAVLHATTEADLHAAVERATADLDGVVAIFQALLRIAEIEAGARRSNFAELDLAHLLTDLEELYQFAAEERGIRLRTVAPDRLPVFGDRELIQQAIANLLDNALKFSPEGSTIQLVATRDQNHVEVTVADQGPGISATDIAHAAERFFRAESARNTPGSGLGLALVAAVAQLHNGSLRLEDNAPGLRAIISLPAASLPAPRVPPVMTSRNADSYTTGP